MSLMLKPGDFQMKNCEKVRADAPKLVSKFLAISLRQRKKLQSYSDGSGYFLSASSGHTVVYCESPSILEELFICKPNKY